jgi:hypothetical protein
MVFELDFEGWIGVSPLLLQSVELMCKKPGNSKQHILGQLLGRSKGAKDACGQGVLTWALGVEGGGQVWTDMLSLRCPGSEVLQRKLRMNCGRGGCPYGAECVRLPITERGEPQAKPQHSRAERGSRGADRARAAGEENQGQYVPQVMSPCLGGKW